jgi:hypothetical protein
LLEQSRLLKPQSAEFRNHLWPVVLPGIRIARQEIDGENLCSLYAYYKWRSFIIHGSILTKSSMRPCEDLRRLKIRECLSRSASSRAPCSAASG